MIPDTKQRVINAKRIGCGVAFVLGIILIDLIGMMMSLLLPAWQAARQAAEGIQVTIENTGGQPLGSVWLQVAGASYELGNIAAGASAQTRVWPTGESHVEIEFTDADRKWKQLDAGRPFERGYRRAIRISIKDGVIDKNEEEAGAP
jgi:hypothetical protein